MNRVKYAFLAGAFTSLTVILIFVWASSGTLTEPGLTQLTSTSEQTAHKTAANDTFTVMTYNVGFLAGMSNGARVRENREFYQKNLNSVVHLLQTVQPDFVGMQEIDLRSHRSHNINQADALSRQASFPHMAYAVNWDKNYVAYPYWPPSSHFGKVLSGQAILSKFPLSFHQRVVLERPTEMPFYWNAFYIDRLAQIVKIDIGRELIIINVHLEAYEQATRARQAVAILALLRQYKQNYPVLLIGDFNSLSPYAGLAAGTGSRPLENDLHDPTIKTILQELGMAAAFSPATFAESESQGFTWSSANPAMKIDYIFYDTTRMKAIEAFVAHEAGQASDHLPVVMRFKFINIGE